MTDTDMIIRLDPLHARLRLSHSELTGAVVALLKALHDAGGYVVFDPRHQGPVQRAMQATEAAVQAAIDVASIPMNGD